MTSPLFKPFSGGGLELPNRIVMAPMTRRFSPDGVPTKEVAAYYERRADADVGLIVTEGAWINHASAANAKDVPRFYGEDALSQWRHITQRVHAVGGHIAPQLWHVGAQAQDTTSDSRPDRILSPSGFYRPGVTSGAPMSQSEIDAVIDAYAQGAAAAQKIGCDAVEFHGAHGYLIDQFFWDKTNLRTDRYGGDLGARTRFAVEMLTECRQRVGPDFPLILRLSQFKAEYYDTKLARDPFELADLIEPLADAGVSIFHCSQRRFWQPEFDKSDLNFAGWVKKLSGVPTISVGSVGMAADAITNLYLKPGSISAPASLERLEFMLERGDFDLVAIGRGLLHDPLWAQKVRLGRFEELKPYSAESLTRLF